MILVPNGIRGTENMDRTTPQGNTVLGTASLTALDNVVRPSQSEHNLAILQGKIFAYVVKALTGIRKKDTIIGKKEDFRGINQILKDKNIKLPKIPSTAGNYFPYVRTGNLVYINQYAMANGKIVHPGKVLVDVTRSHQGRHVKCIDSTERSGRRRSQ